jgi:tetratricopeptide (TPR) repeat protein
MFKVRLESLVIFIFIIFLHQTSFAQNPADECETLFEKGNQALQSKQYSEALEYFTKGEMLAQENNLYEKVYYAKNLIGIVYYSLYNYSEALNYYLEAYTYALKHLGYTQEVAILNNIAILYGDDQQFEKSEEYLLKAYHIVEKEHDSTRMAHYAINLGILNGRTKKYDEAKERLYEAMSLVDESQKILILKARSALAEVYISLQKYDFAKKVIDQIGDDALRLSPNDIYIATLIQLSKYYHHKKEYDKAIEMCHTALEYNSDIRNKVQIFEQLSKVNYHKKDFDAAVKYKDSIISANDSIYRTKSNQMYEGNKVKFELQTYVHELNTKQKQLNVERKIFGAAASAFVILIFLVYRIYRNKAVQELQKKEIALRENKIIALELEKKNQEHLILEKQLKTMEIQSLLEQEQLKNEIEQKNRQLTSKALYLSSRNEIIEELIQSLSGLPGVNSNAELKKILRQLNENVQPDEHWNSFFTHFEEVNQGLITELKNRHPDLNANDIRFICYVFMNLTSKEIASIFNITQEACRKRKERISKKIGLDNGESLYEYLTQLSVNKV